MEPELPLVGMTREVQRLSAVLHRKNESLLIVGPMGCGKTRLISEALRIHGNSLYIAWQPTLHGLLVAIARVLIAAGNRSFLDRAMPGPDKEAWLSKQSSIHLKGLLWSALEHAPVVLILDGVAGAGFPTYRFLQRIYHTPGMTVIAAARDAVAMGALSRLFWDPRHVLNVPALNDRDAAQLFNVAADHFRLRDLDLEEFREKVLENAGGNPGLIIEMCRLATQPQYLAGRYVKFGPLCIDSLIRFTG
jgi:hypothetical protein